MAEPGIEVVETILPDLIKAENINLVIAQAENVSDGKGITIRDYERLKRAGIDFFTGGNWTTYREEIYNLLGDKTAPIIKPANFPETGGPGLGYKYITKGSHKVLVVSLLGSIVGRDADKPKANPLTTIDKILESSVSEKPNEIIVNFHGDLSSEKVIVGHYLDGRVSAVVGDHWHVPTADARILPKGTAHITDVGMCGILNASLGVSLNSVLPRWKDGQQTRNVLETNGPRQFNAVLISTGRTIAIKQIQRIIGGQEGQISV